MSTWKVREVVEPPLVITSCSVKLYCGAWFQSASVWATERATMSFTSAPYSAIQASGRSVTKSFINDETSTRSATLVKIKNSRMIDDQLADLQTTSLSRISGAANAAEIEQIRVDVLGRKGSLTQISR